MMVCQSMQVAKIGAVQDGLAGLDVQCTVSQFCQGSHVVGKHRTSNAERETTKTYNVGRVLP